jgi:aspartyl-tRNA synthetase
MLRTHTCGELNLNQAGTRVSLCGWVDRHRDLGNLFFISLRDRYGLTQCVFEGESQILSQLHLEDCLQIQGAVRARSEKDRNSAMATGDVEILIEDVKVLNRSATLPFAVKDQTEASDDLRLKYRYLDLRRPKMQANLTLRHRVIQASRTALSRMGFLEIETPLLIRSTPEGARDFVVPSRLQPGKFYALPQSPQLYKQMLMISGCDRYFQFAPAFRDEDLRADRMPVHTQIDMEMSFVEEKDVFCAVETYMEEIFRDILGRDLPRPFLIMSYGEAMERFGCDKPDVRFGLELMTVTDQAKEWDFPLFKDAPTVRALLIRESEGAGLVARKDLDRLTQGAKGLAWAKKAETGFTGGMAKFLRDDLPLFQKLELAPGDLLFFVGGTYEKTSKTLSQIRLEMGKKLGLIPHDQHAFLWVNDFPLFEWDEDTQGYQAMHHLFTHPKEEDLPYLDTDPGRVRGQLYDLVLNGVELCSGSIRIHRPELQQKILDIVRMPKEEAQSKFGFLMDAFAYGAPPHGGTGLGLDRLVAILAGSDSIREVIAFPCNNQGVFPLDGSPAPISEVQRKELGL